MKSFRTEIEDQIVERDIVELEKKIYAFKNGQLDEESFRSLRLARGVYGQRQQGVQMIRIKLPLGIIRPDQLRRIADIADEYSDGNLHITTRQDIQIHHVSLDRTPELWSELEKDQITLREACGNTVRNITASPYAGVDKEELFDITDYGWTLFDFFLRNPVGQEMGRKFKIAFSATEKDLARTYLHDLGFIPAIKNEEKGFKVLVGGGLGAQPALAETLVEFLPASELLAYAEAIVRVFDKNGERNKRHKARIKFLLKEVGLEVIKEKLEQELEFVKGDDVLHPKPYYINATANEDPAILNGTAAYSNWNDTNVIEQNNGLYSAIVKVRNGNISSDQARELADLIEKYSEEEARLTIEQNLVIRSVPESLLTNLYNGLQAIELSDFGANTILDITACPGTRTCNLGITASYNVAEVIEDLVRNEYPEVVNSGDIRIKISGCMNSCGQHAVADIGFHGSTIRAEEGTVPALQVLLGGTIIGNGDAQLADKVIKIPTKRVESIIRRLLNDFQINREEEEKFNGYYNRQGKIYFYDLLKSLASVDEVDDSEYLDWGSEERFKPEIGVGECAGVKIDLVQTLLFEAAEKIDEAKYFAALKQFNDAVYTAYSSIIQSAKAFLVKEGQKTNSKTQIELAFEPYFGLVKDNADFNSFDSFAELIALTQQKNPSEEGAINTIKLATSLNEFLKEISNDQK